MITSDIDEELDDDDDDDDDDDQLSSRKVLVLEDLLGPIFKSLSLSLSSEVQVLENFRGLSRLSVSALCAGLSAGVAMT